MNAIQAMPRGGEVRVGISAVRARPPAASEQPERRYIRIEVRDQGEGISPQVREHLFEPFFTTKPVGEGTGLGLSVSHGIIREHGGFIAVESESGSGSTFSIHLPDERNGAP
jgi:signal transduction histidine kinase